MTHPSHRTDFRARVRKLQADECGGNFEEALIAATADALHDLKKAAARSEHRLAGADAHLQTVLEESGALELLAHAGVDAEPEPEPPKKKRGRPRKAAKG